MVEPLHRFHLLSSLAFGLTPAHPAPCPGTEKPPCALEPGLGTGCMVAGCSWLGPGEVPKASECPRVLCLFFSFAHL